MLIAEAPVSRDQSRRTRPSSRERRSAGTTKVTDNFLISPGFRVSDWIALRRVLPADGGLDDDSRSSWVRAVEVLERRIRTRFLEPARLLLASRSAGFSVLLIDCAVVETAQRLRSESPQTSRARVTKFLREQPSFRPYFDDGTPHRAVDKNCPCVACSFYRHVRSSLVHGTETAAGWLIRARETALLSGRQGRWVLDRTRFHHGVVTEFAAYCSDLTAGPDRELRRRLRAAIDTICGLSTPNLTRAPRERFAER